MGQFSWLDCKTGKQIVDNKQKKVYVLIPKEFGGGHICEECYDGYGRFGRYDMYDLVALWNRKYISKDNLRGMPQRENFSDGVEGDMYYGAAVKRYQRSCDKIADFVNGIDDKEMKEKYGYYYLREIGIDIACYDEQQKNLKYPIKITYDDRATYEECDDFSKNDPNQGWETTEDDDDEEGWW